MQFKYILFESVIISMSVALSMSNHFTKLKLYHDKSYLFLKYLVTVKILLLPSPGLII